MADTVIPLDPASNSKTNPQGNRPSGSVVIPENPVNLDGYTIVDGVAEGGPDDPKPKLPK
jgi:hypothetical protein